MHILGQFILKTKELRDHLKSEPSSENRDAFILTVQGLLEERQQLLNDFPDLSSLLDDRHKKELMELEAEIKGLMDRHQNLIKQDIRNLQLKKQKGTSYSNPYGNLSIDGMFLDKKK